MGYSFNDITNGTQKVIDATNKRLETNSERKAEEIVSRFNGSRGFWVFLHAPAFIFIIAGTGNYLQMIFKLPMPIAMLVGLVTAVLWWRADFTKSKPFVSYLLASAYPFLFVFLLNKKLFHLPH